MTSFIENDPLKCFFALERGELVFIGVVISIVAYWLIDAVSSTNDERIDPILGTWPRWYTNWVGDPVCLTTAVVFIARFYHHADASYDWLTTSWLWLIPTAIALGYTWLFWNRENRGGSYLGADVYNPNRLYHAAYMAFMVYILSGAGLRAVVNWSYRESDAWFALIAFGGWVFTLVLDSIGFPSPLWWLVRRRGYTGRFVG